VFGAFTQPDGPHESSVQALPSSQPAGTHASPQHMPGAHASSSTHSAPSQRARWHPVSGTQLAGVQPGYWQPKPSTHEPPSLAVQAESSGSWRHVPSSQRSIVHSKPSSHAPSPVHPEPPSGIAASGSILRCTQPATGSHHSVARHAPTTVATRHTPLSQSARAQ
jgi:hypothetical protein